MQFDKAEKLRKAWIAKGDPPCDHPEISKEYGYTVDSGDYRCDTCGKQLSKSERRGRM